MAVITLIATCYYPHPTKALRRPTAKKSWKGYSGHLTIHLDNGGTMNLELEPREHYLAAIEATARVDLIAMGITGEATISWYEGRWYLHTWAPHGVGARLNALVPGRTFATYHHAWPYGTRIEIVEAPQELDGRIRKTMYRGGSFGKPHPPERVDLFVAEPCQFKGRIKVIATKPWAGVSRDPTKGCQQALMIQGYDLPRWKDDGVWGPETQTALEAWYHDHNHLFPYGRGPRFVPWDEEVFFLVRETAQKAKEAPP